MKTIPPQIIWKDKEKNPLTLTMQEYQNWIRMPIEEKNRLRFLELRGHSYSTTSIEEITAPRQVKEKPIALPAEEESPLISQEKQKKVQKAIREVTELMAQKYGGTSFGASWREAWRKMREREANEHKADGTLKKQ